MDKLIFIPAYKPDGRLPELCRKLSGIYSVLVVDDGSGRDFDEVFEAASESATVLRYEKNRGKGGALKYGYSKIPELFPEVNYIITADADGQHTPEDIAKVAEKVESAGGLVLGSRKFTGKVPFRSAFGNSLTRFVFKVASGAYVRDTQTGLRAFGKEYLEEFSSLKGDRYEYEMTQLMYCAAEKIPMTEVDIETIYENDNETSHFNPIKDSFKIYKVIYLNSTFLKFITSSLIAFLIDFLLYLFLTNVVFTKEYLVESPEFLKNLLTSASVSMALAWVVSSFVNFLLNRNWAFRSDKHFGASLIEYYSLAIVSMLIKAFAITPLLKLIHVPNVLTYLIANVVMYLINYIVQKKFIFKKKS